MIRVARAIPRLFLAGLVVVVAGAGMCWGAPDESSAQWEVSPPAPRVGDPVTVRLQVAADPGGIESAGDALAGAVQNIRGAEVVQNRALASVTQPDGRQTAGIELTLYRDLPGAIELPEVRIETGTGTVASAARSVPVAGVFDPGHPPAPAPPKGGMALPLSWGYVLAGVAALGAVILGVAYGVRRYLRRPAAQPATPAAPAPRPDPAAMALERIGRLEGQPPAVALEALSTILRDYLAERYGLPSRERTASELQQLLAQGDRPDLAAVGAWLCEWEPVKFARSAPDAGTASRAVQEARRWISREAAVSSGPPAP